MEKVRRKKMQVREKVGKSQFTEFFQWFAEPVGQMRDEKVHAVVARSTFPSQTCQKLRARATFWRSDVDHHHHHHNNNNNNNNNYYYYYYSTATPHFTKRRYTNYNYNNKNKNKNNNKNKNKNNNNNNYYYYYYYHHHHYYYYYYYHYYYYYYYYYFNCNYNYNYNYYSNYNYNYNNHNNYNNHSNYNNYSYTTTTTTTTTSTQLQLQLQLRYNYTTLHYTKRHYTNYNYNQNYNYATLHYTTQDYTTLHYPTLHYTRPITPTTIWPQLHYTNYTTPQLQLHYATTTTTAAAHHTTSSSCGWGDHCNHCNHSNKHNSNHLLVNQWIPSAIRDSQQPCAPIGFQTSATALCGTTGISSVLSYQVPTIEGDSDAHHADSTSVLAMLTNNRESTNTGVSTMGVPPNHFRLGFPMKKTIQLLGYPMDLPAPFGRWDQGQGDPGVTRKPPGWLGNHSQSWDHSRCRKVMESPDSIHLSTYLRSPIDQVSNCYLIFWYFRIGRPIQR